MAMITCECGHVNPEGTELCQKCGNPFDEQDEGILYMRYEGAALRSRTRKKTWIDSIWNFFASVKIGVLLLVITLVASIFGTIYPQAMHLPTNIDPYQYYPEQYGKAGLLYVTLGFHNLYSSWWYITLIALSGISIIISSIDRGVPLYRSLKNQQVRRHPRFMARQRLNGEAVVDDPEQMLAKASQALSAMGYKVSTGDRAIMGEKHRFSRWGGYVVHLGLIILLIGAMMRIIPGFAMEQYVWIRDGETVPVPGTNNAYYIKSEGFSVRFYDLEGDDRLIPEEFRTEAVLYENKAQASGQKELVEVKRQTIRVNEPLRYEGLTFYQSDYKVNEFSLFHFALTHKESGEEMGTLAIDLFDPAPRYDLGNGYVVELVEYYPDFELDAQKQLQTKSPIPNNPAFIFKVTTPDNRQETSMVLIGQTIEPLDEKNEYALKIKDIEFKNVTGLKVSKERSLPIIFTGLAIIMVGLLISFYWHHKRIWIQEQEGKIVLAAYTHKNWYAFKNEVMRLIDLAELPLDKGTLDKEESQNERTAD